MTTSCGPAPQPAAPSSSLARIRRAAVGEPPPHAKIGELWCYDDKRADEFIQWRADADAACEDEVADKQLDADVAKIREGSISSGVSFEMLLVILLGGVGAAFAGGTALGAAIAK